MATLNTLWHQIISKHYSWSRFPERGPRCLVSSFLNFFNSFSELTGIDIPDVPLELLTEHYHIAKLQTAKSVAVRRICTQESFFIVLENNPFLKTVRELTIRLSIPEPGLAVKFHNLITSASFLDLIRDTTVLTLLTTL